MASRCDGRLLVRFESLFRHGLLLDRANVHRTDSRTGHGATLMLVWPELESIPTRLKWSELRERFAASVGQQFSRWISPDQPHFRDQLAFALGRVDEGAGLVRFFAMNGPHHDHGDVLDIGSGNGGVAFAFANCLDYDVHTLDTIRNPQLRESRSVLGLPLRSIVGNGAILPFTEDSFDLVLLFDVFEHLSRPAEVASEVMRVLRPGGVCLISTPARLRYIFRPDPHYGIRGLLLLPNGVQRFVVNRLFRRRIVGGDGVLRDAYDVEHTYWHVAEIAKLFPGPRTVDVLYKHGFSAPGRFSSQLIWRPKSAIEQL